MKKRIIITLCLILIKTNFFIYGKNKGPDELEKIQNLFIEFADFLNIEFSGRFVFEGLDKPFDTLAQFQYTGVDPTKGLKNTEDSSLLSILYLHASLTYNIAKDIKDIRERNKNFNNNNLDNFYDRIDSLLDYCEERVKTLSKYEIPGEENVYDTTKALDEFKSDFMPRIEKKKSEVERDFEKLKSNVLEDFPPVKFRQKQKSDVDEIKEQIGRLKLISSLAFFAGFISVIAWIAFFLVRARNTDNKGIPLNVKKHLNTELKMRDNSIKDLERKTSGINEINIKIRELKTQIYKLQDYISVMKTSLPGMPEVEEDSRETEFKVEPPKKIETYYLPFPDQNGFFWDEKKSKTQQSDTPYILEIDLVNPNKGELTLIDNRPALIRNAITSADTFLKPVCMIEGLANGDKITVISKGQLERQNDKWQIVDNKKMVIRIHN